MRSCRNKGVTRVTKFQNCRQRWISPFSVGVTKVQKVASLSLRFILKKLMNSAQVLNVAPVTPKISIPILQKSNIKFKRILSKKIKIPALECTGTHLELSALLPVSPSYYDRRYFGGHEGRCGLSPRPYYLKDWSNVYE